jgi:hypothetical protein
MAELFFAERREVISDKKTRDYAKRKEVILIKH